MEKYNLMVRFTVGEKTEYVVLGIENNYHLYGSEEEQIRNEFIKWLQTNGANYEIIF